MKITVLWEDQRGVASNQFGPQLLLHACVADDLGTPIDALEDLLHGNPRKGNALVLKYLKDQGTLLRDAGPVFAVVDRDRIHKLFQPPARNCKAGIRKRFEEEAPGDYDLVLLENNVETLLEVACIALGQPIPTKKSRPDQRDRILSKAAWSATPDVRHAIRNACPSFERLVRRVKAAVENCQPGRAGK